METKHTEGPWWRAGTDIGAGNMVIAVVTCGPGRTAEAEANARIMVAGLELVEALEGLQASWMDEPCFCVVTWLGRGHMERCENATAALAKARGE